MQIFVRFFCRYGIIFVPLQSENGINHFQMTKKTTFIALLLGVAASVCAQVHVRTFSEQIRTLRVARTYLILNEATIDGSDPDNTLHISFDEMSHDVHFYTYSVKHMCADWSRESDILSGEYLTGFTTQDITDYEHSLNTSREYTHYWFDFPNQEMAITRSGNYRLTIYEDGNPDNRVAEVDLTVTEPLVPIDARVRSNTDIELSGRYQQVDVDVNLQNTDISYQPSEFRVVVTQNNRMDNAVVLTQPTFVEPQRLRYINTKALIFEGGNEYRHFDAFSTYYAGTGIDRIHYELGDYHALLFTDEPTRGQYIHQYDSNGRFVVNAERTSDSDTEAEYMWVHWTLPIEKPWFDGALYIGGDIFGNEMGLRNRMQYDAEAKCYWLTALVKQGGYDYQYWFVPKETKDESRKPKAQNATTTQRVDGSYWQTENEYTVYVYWRPFGARYDRLVGVRTVR